MLGSMKILAKKEAQDGYYELRQRPYYYSGHECFVFEINHISSKGIFKNVFESHYVGKLYMGLEVSIETEIFRALLKFEELK